MLVLRVHLLRSLVFCDRLVDFVELLQGVRLPDGDPEVHLRDSLLVVGTVLTIISVLVVLDQADGIVALGDDSVVAL